MVVWFSKECIDHVQKPCDIRTKIAAIQTIIDTLDAAMLNAALTGNIKEYSFDDGMTKTRMEYKDIETMNAAVNALMARQQVLLQSPGLNNRVVRLIDSKNMPNYFPINGFPI